MTVQHLRAVLALLLITGLVDPAFALTVNVTSAPYNAMCDGQICLDCSIAVGSGVLSSLTSRFVPGDVGKVIAVYGAGPATAGFLQPLSTTISEFTDAKHVTLTATASTTVTNSERVVWGTNDSVALQAAVDAVANASGGTVQFPSGICLVLWLAITVTYRPVMRQRPSDPWQRAWPGARQDLGG